MTQGWFRNFQCCWCCGGVGFEPMDPLRGLRFQDRCARLRAHKPLRSGHIRVLTPIASPVAKELGSRTALAAQTASDLQVYRCRRAGSDRRRHRQPGTRVGRLAPPVPLRIRRLGVRIPPGALCVETENCRSEARTHSTCSEPLACRGAGWAHCGRIGHADREEWAEIRQHPQRLVLGQRTRTDAHTGPR